MTRINEKELEEAYEKSIDILINTLMDTAEKLDGGGEETPKDRANLYAAMAMMVMVVRRIGK